MILEDLKNKLSKLGNQGTKAILDFKNTSKKSYFTPQYACNNQCVASFNSHILMHTREALLMDRENSGFSM